MPYRVVRKLTDTEAAYLAGLIDGEGTITMSRRHRGDMRQLVVSISSTEPEMLEWAAITVGAGKITRKRTVSIRHAPGFTFAVSNRQALAPLEQVFPYLRSYKRERAALVIDKYVACVPRNGKYAPELRAAREIFEREILDTRPRVASVLPCNAQLRTQRNPGNDQ